MPPIGYIDPGTGSVLLQTLIAGAAAAGVAFKFYGRRLLVFLRLRKPEPESAEPQSK